MAEQPSSVSDAARVRAFLRLLVPDGGGLEAYAFCADARADHGHQRVVKSGSNLRTFDLFGGILSAHMGQLAASFHRLPAGHRDRRTARTLPGMVAAVQGICLSGLRIVAPDPAARLGAVGDHHVPRLGDPDRIPDVSRLFLCDHAQHDARGRIDRRVLRSCRLLPRSKKTAGFLARGCAGRDAFHLYRTADFGRRRVVLPGCRRNGIGPIRPRISHQYVLHHGAVPDDGDWHDHVGGGGVRDERSGAHFRQLSDAMAGARVGHGGRKVNRAPLPTYDRPIADVKAPVSQSAERHKGEIRIADVVKIYGSETAKIRAVDNCTFDVPAGKITVVVGPSGCGKTTLLNAIAGFHSITSGAIYLDDTLLCGPGRLSAEPGPDRIVVFQNGALFPWKTIIENVAFGPMMQGRLSKKQAFEKGRAMLAEAGLRDLESNYPGEISSGMRRRVVIMTTRPCRPKKILTVDIPHPRDYSVLTTKRFREYLDETIAAVHEEALKAFAAGERER